MRRSQPIRGELAVFVGDVDAAIDDDQTFPVEGADGSPGAGALARPEFLAAVRIQRVDRAADRHEDDAARQHGRGVAATVLPYHLEIHSPAAIGGPAITRRRSW